MRMTTMRAGYPELVEVDDDQLFEFYPGLSGFEDQNRYALMDDDGSMLQWLQAVGAPSVCFGVVDPWGFLSDYAFELPDADADALGVKGSNDVIVRVILTLRSPMAAITANLMAPLVINLTTRLGRQVVLQDSDFPARYAIFEGRDTGDLGNGGEQRHARAA